MRTIEKQKTTQTPLTSSAQWEEEPAQAEILIRPSKAWASIDLRELLEYRELLFFLVWRDIKVRYKQTLLGAAWAVLQPFLTMVVFSIFFGWLAGMPSDGVPYPLFVYTALVPWTFFANALTHASNSLIEHERMLTKVYFPRLLIPMAAVLAGFIDFRRRLMVGSVKCAISRCSLCRAFPDSVVALCYANRLFK